MNTDSQLARIASVGGLVVGLALALSDSACLPAASACSEASCPVAAAPADCATHTDGVGRCSEAWPGSIPLYLKRDELTPRDCAAPGFGLFVGPVTCGEDNELELWCVK